MAKKRRTRKQKKAARKYRLIVKKKNKYVVSKKSKTSGKQVQAGREARQSARQELGNKKLIMKDLRKTIIVGLIVSGALAGIYFFWR